MAFFHFRRGLSLLGKNPDDQALAAMLHNNLGLLYLAQGMRQEAYESFVASIKQHKNPIAALNAAALAVEFALYKSALDHLSFVPANDSEGQAIRLRAHRGMGQIAPALALYSKLPPTLQKREDVAYTVALIYMQQHQYDNALKTLEGYRPFSVKILGQKTEKLLAQIEQLNDESKEKADAAAPARATASGDGRVREHENLAQRRAPKTRDP
jgi:tetratricopeptide (TPR) repeat protein